MPVQARVLSLLIAAILAATTVSAAVWQPVGPQGGTVTALAVAPAAVYAGTNGGGVFKSTDQGATWVPASAGLPNRFVAALALDPANPERLYAGVGDRLFRTGDGGASWTPADAGLPREKVRAVAVDADDPSTLYAAYSALGSRSELHPGIFRSTDRGESWSAVHVGQFVTRLATAPGAVFAGTLAGVFRSLDGGLTWTRAFEAPEVLALAVQGRWVYASSAGGFFRSDDLGESWTRIDLAPVPGQVTAIAIAPSGAVYAGTSRLSELRPRLGTLVRSLDGGRTWARSGTGMGRQDFLALAVDPASPSRVYAGVAGVGVFRSRDAGASWTHSAAGLRALAFAELELDAKRPTILYGMSEIGLLKTTDAGAAWRVLGTGLSGPLALDPVRTMTVFARSGDLVLRSRDGGETWVPTGLPPGSTGALAVDPLVSGTLYVAGYYGDYYGIRIFRSVDYGRTWKESRLSCMSPRALAVAPQSTHLLMGGGPFCPRLAGGGIRRSHDRGRSWSPVNEGIPEGQNAFVDEVAIDPRDPSRAYASGSNPGLFPQSPPPGRFALHSLDAGETWSPIPGFGGRRALAFAFPLGSPATVYIGTDLGVWESRDRGETWRILGEGLESFEVRDLALAPGDTALYAATAGGVFRLNLR